MGKCIGRGGFGEVLLLLLLHRRWCQWCCGVHLRASCCADLFLQVYKGTWRGTDVAVKRLLQQDIGKDCGMLDAFCQEVTFECDV